MANGWLADRETNKQNTLASWPRMENSVLAMLVGGLPRIIGEGISKLKGKIK